MESQQFNELIAVMKVMCNQGTGLLTNKGDLLTFSTLLAKLPLGTVGQVLTAEPTDPTGLRWETPVSASGLSIYGSFFQTVFDVAGTIASDNGKVLFQTAGLLSAPAHFIFVPASGVIQLPFKGNYEINFSLTCAEAGAMSIYVNGMKIPNTCFGTGAGTQNITGSAILNINANDIVSLRSDNCPAALTLQLAGTTNTNENVAFISFKKLN